MHNVHRMHHMHHIIRMYLSLPSCFSLSVSLSTSQFILHPRSPFFSIQVFHSHRCLSFSVVLSLCFPVVCSPFLIFLAVSPNASVTLPHCITSFTTIDDPNVHGHEHAHVHGHVHVHVHVHVLN